MSSDLALKTEPLPLVEIDANESFNCRGPIAPLDVYDLMKSIKEHGLLEPVVVRVYDEEKRLATGKKYGLVAGYRRFSASKLNGAQLIRATIHPHMSEEAARVLNITENLKRKDLNMKQEAHAIEHFKFQFWNADRIAAELNVSRTWVDVRLMVLDFPNDIQDVIAADLLTQEQIRQIHKMPRDKQYLAVRAIKQRHEKTEAPAAAEIIAEEKKHKVNPKEKRTRKRPELFQLQHLIREATGPNILTRILGWAAGEVTNEDMYNDLKEHMDSYYGISLDVEFAEPVEESF